MHQKKLDEMGHLHLLLDEMGLDEMGINRSNHIRCEKLAGANFLAVM